MPRGVDRYDEAIRQGRLWTPLLARPSLLAWLDASDLSTISVATGVSTWADKSGNGRNATQATGANQPIFSANPFGITFANVTARRLNVPMGDNYDVLVVGNPETASQWQSLIFVQSANYVGMIEDLSTNFGVYGPVFHSAGSLTWSSQEGIAYGSARGTTNIQWSRDGGALNDVINETVILNNGTSTICIGNDGDGNHFGFGTIREMIFFSVSSTTTPAFKELAEGYAAWKWKALGAGDYVGFLPASHRFKNRPPLIGD